MYERKTNRKAAPGKELGRPKHRVTKKNRTQVEELAKYGIQHHIIAAILKIDVKTLNKHYKRELEVAKATAVSVIAGKLYKQAVDGCFKSQRLYLMTQGGWTLKNALDNFGVIAHVTADKSDKDYTDPVEAMKYYKQMVKDL